MGNRRRPQGVTKAVIAALLASAAVVPLAATATTTDTRGFRGHFVGEDDRTAVAFEIRRRGGKNLTAQFRVRGLSLVCNGTFPNRNFGPDRFKFIGPRMFQGQRYERLGEGNWSYYEVQGRLLGRGRATGYVYYVQDSYGDPESAPPDCNTGGQLYDRWLARRR